MSAFVLLVSAGCYLLLLFAVAWRADRAAERGRYRQRPLIFALALAVYATSWTYFGAIGQAANSTWAWVPIYLGPVLVFLFGRPLLRRIVVMSKEYNITSLADFIAVRYGGDSRIGAVITLIAVLSVLPYMALQLKSVVNSFRVLAPDTQDIDVALLTAGGLGFFAILFGTRHVAANERQSGLVFAVAFESAIKLSAFLIVAVSVLYFVGPFPELTQPTPTQFRSGDGISFVINTVLAAIAVVCLPRQFHLLAVESENHKDLRTARWVLPAYLLGISLLVVPVAMRGVAVFGPGVDGDTFLMRLPLEAEQPALALLAFIGGFSAATAMVIVSSIALAIMISNEWVMPQLLKNARWVERRDLGRVLVQVRRLAIALVLIGSYVFYQWMAVEASLATTGLIAFVGIAQLAPALIVALYWRGANRLGVLSGLIVGFLVWSYTLLIPAFFSHSDWLHSGPWGVAVLAPYQLFGMYGLEPVSHATIWSLGLNALTVFMVSTMTATTLVEQFQSRTYEPSSEARRGRLRVADLVVVVERFYGPERAQSLFEEFHQKYPDQAVGNAIASSVLVAFVEQRLAAAMGASTARALINALYSGSSDVVREVARVIEQTSGVVRFNRDLLQATLDSISHAVSVVDAEQRLVAWNQAYQTLFDLPEHLLAEGEPIEHILRYNGARGWLGPGDPEESIQRRLAHLHSHTPYRHERQLPNGRVLELRGDPMPGGGFVTTFADITEYVKVSRELQQANISLEHRVSRRTEALEEANQALQVARAAAESANRGKTRFLAAAGHDLMQPLNAARLFIASGSQAAGADEGLQETLHNAERALQSMETVLSDLLDISKLDAGVWEARMQSVVLSDVLETLCRECSVLAREKGLELRIAKTSVVVESDPVLLRRILQNFLSNAVRYTESGRVLIGVRRRGDEVRVEVWDSGPGIDKENQGRIFEEFSRVQTSSKEKGFGLGLAICARMANLLGHRITMRSSVGKGSCFGLELRRVHGRAARQLARNRNEVKSRPAVKHSRLEGGRVLCIDNEPQVLQAMQKLLSSWGCEVESAHDQESALKALASFRPKVIVADYHLDNEVLGVDVVRRLRVQAKHEIPAVLVTADQSAESARDARAAGMTVLRKPVKPAALRAMLSRLLV